jgi:bifunctional DNA-binding transcriptional regulator/antitoxin component of YhaV-PrlF toxin-antitoxin module
MIITKIGKDYTLNIPQALRQKLTIGQEVGVSADIQGRLIVTPLEQIQTVLLETFGLWADRTDLPTDSIDYMDQIRQGQRLDQLEPRVDEDH